MVTVATCSGHVLCVPQLCATCVFFPSLCVFSVGSRAGVPPACPLGRWSCVPTPMAVCSEPHPTVSLYVYPHLPWASREGFPTWASVHVHTARRVRPAAAWRMGNGEGGGLRSNVSIPSGGFGIMAKQAANGGRGLQAPGLCHWRISPVTTLVHLPDPHRVQLTGPSEFGACWFWLPVVACVANLP